GVWQQTVPAGCSNVTPPACNAGVGNGQFSHPTYITIDGSGNIWTTDGTRVQKFNSAGVFQSTFGTYGTGNGQFNQPFGISIDGSGNIWVSDWGFGPATPRVEKFNSSGSFLSKFGSFGSGNGQFNMPKGNVLVSASSVQPEYIWVPGNNQVRKYDTSGT